MTQAKNIFNPETVVITQKGKKETIPCFDRVVTVDYEEGETLKKIKSVVRATSVYTGIMNNIANAFITSKKRMEEILNCEIILAVCKEIKKDLDKAKLKNPNAKPKFDKFYNVLGFDTETIRQRGLGNIKKDVSTIFKCVVGIYSQKNIQKGFQLMFDRQLEEYKDGIRKNLKPITITMQGIEKAMAELTRQPKENSNAWLVDTIMKLSQAKKEENWELVEEALTVLKEKE